MINLWYHEIDYIWKWWHHHFHNRVWEDRYRNEIGKMWNAFHVGGRSCTFSCMSFGARHGDEVWLTENILSQEWAPSGSSWLGSFICALIMFSMRILCDFAIAAPDYQDTRESNVINSLWFWRGIIIHNAPHVTGIFVLAKLDNTYLPRFHPLPSFLPLNADSTVLSASRCRSFNSPLIIF